MGQSVKRELSTRRQTGETPATDTYIIDDDYGRAEWSFVFLSLSPHSSFLSLLAANKFIIKIESNDFYESPDDEKERWVRQLETSILLLIYELSSTRDEKLSVVLVCSTVWFYRTIHYRPQLWETPPRHVSFDTR